MERKLFYKPRISVTQPRTKTHVSTIIQILNSSHILANAHWMVKTVDSVEVYLEQNHTLMLWQNLRTCMKKVAVILQTDTTWKHKRLTLLQTTIQKFYNQLSKKVSELSTGHTCGITGTTTNLRTKVQKHQIRKKLGIVLKE